MKLPEQTEFKIDESITWLEHKTGEEITEGLFRDFVMTGKLTGKMTYPHYFETDLMTGTETFLGMGKEQIFSLNELQNFVKTFCDDSPEIEPTAAAHPYLIKKAIQPHQLDATTASG